MERDDEEEEEESVMTVEVLVVVVEVCVVVVGSADEMAVDEEDGEGEDEGRGVEEADEEMTGVELVVMTAAAVLRVVDTTADDDDDETATLDADVATAVDEALALLLVVVFPPLPTQAKLIFVVLATGSPPSTGKERSQSILTYGQQSLSPMLTMSPATYVFVLDTGLPRTSPVEETSW